MSVLSLSPVLHAEPLTPMEKLGKQIYLKTVSPSGKEIKAYIGIASTEAPGSVMPCVNCHGRNGKGRPGSGIIPSNITFQELTKPYEVIRNSGRRHPAYDKEALARAIARGIDPAGNPLNPAMPVYSMDREDLDALTAYLKHLGTELDPGLSNTRIRVGTFFPKEGRFNESGQAMKAVLMAYFNEVNLHGGIYNRRIELETMEYGGEEQSPVFSVKRLIGEREVFAVVGGISPGADREVSELLENAEVPLIGPYAFSPQNLSLNRYTFYLFSGLREQIVALLSFSKKRLPAPNPLAAIIYPEEEIPAEAMETISEQIKTMGWSSTALISYSPRRMEPASLVRDLIQKRVEALYFFGSWEELKAILREGSGEGWAPFLFLSGTKVGRDIFDIPIRFSQKVFLAYPTLPSDQTQSGLKEFGSLLAKYGLGGRHLPVQISAYCSAKIFIEGIKLSGRDLNRETLVAMLERLFRFETGLTPRITYGPNRRIGALGSYVVAVNLQKKEFEPAGEWISLE